MSKRQIVVVILLLIVLPTLLYGRWIQDKVYLQTDSVGKIEFSHFDHMAQESIGKNCPTCHNEIFHIVVDKNPPISMAEMGEGKSCGVCHNGVQAFSVSEECTICHADDIEINYGTSEKVVFSHGVHADMFACDECHPDLFTPERNSNQVGMQKMEDGESCGACHDGDTAFGVADDCSSCHEGAEDIAMESLVGTIVFKHSDHTGNYGCDECHPQIFKPEANSNQVGMNRMETGASCGACHDGDTAFGVQADCVACHKNASDLHMQTEEVGRVPFNHTIHTDMFGCRECHPDIFTAKINSNQVGMQKMEKGESCGACHDGDIAFGVTESCNTCHSGKVVYQKDINMMSPVGEVPFSHNVHSEMFTCDDCHPAVFKARANSNQVGMQKMEEGDSCGACHDGSTAFGVNDDCVTCHTGAIDINVQTEHVGPVLFPHSVHTEGFGCDECHPDLYEAKADSSKVGMQRMEAGESCGSCHDGDMAFAVTGDCLTCHTRADEMQMWAENVEPVPFSHAVHIEMFRCDDCHSDIFIAKANNNQVGMQRMEEGDSCGACHDGDSAFSINETCTTCHTGGISYQQDVMIRSTIWAVVFSHNLHTQDFSCDDCHPALFRSKANSTKVGMQKMEEGESCGACHDGDAAFSVAAQDRCSTCHNLSTVASLETGGVGVVPFSHAAHSRGYSCEDCHPSIFSTKVNETKVGMQKMEEGESCGSCHDGSTTFSVDGDCAVCHAGAETVAMQAAPVGSVPFEHEVHTEMFSCDECHPDLFKAKANSTQVGMSSMEDGASCGACHDGGDAFGVTGDCASCHVKAVDVEMSTHSFGLVKFSHENHTEMYSCGDCHPNIFRAQANSNLVGMQMMENGASCGSCHNGNDAFSVKDDCATCHAGDVEFKSFGNTIFSHARHNGLFSCGECHPKIYKPKSGSNPATMEDMKFGQSCGACHNGDRAFGVEKCDPCHPK